MLKHMFTVDEAEAGGASFGSELEADVLAEATKLGAVEKVRVGGCQHVMRRSILNLDPRESCLLGLRLLYTETPPTHNNSKQNKRHRLSKSCLLACSLSTYTT